MVVLRPMVALGVLALDEDPCDFERDPVTSGLRPRKPFNSHVYEVCTLRVSCSDIHWVTATVARAR